MRLLRRLCLFVALGVTAGGVHAQDQTIVVPSPIMVVDFDRIFVETLYGQRISAQINAERERVQSENDRIARELLAEEQELTDARATMETEAFRAAASAFNERAQSVRASREAEQTRLLTLRDEERARFIERIQPIIFALMLERGAVVAMDRRAVIRAIGGANGTVDAINLINETLGDGTQALDDAPTLRPSDRINLPQDPDVTVPDVPALVPDLPASE